jgi:hypothetical protein
MAFGDLNALCIDPAVVFRDQRDKSFDRYRREQVLGPALSFRPCQFQKARPANRDVAYPCTAGLAAKMPLKLS